MNRVFIASPYSGPERDRNVDYARRAVYHSLRLKEAPFASHLIYTQPKVLDDTDPAQRAWGMQASYAWLECCDIAAFYIDLGWSPGMIKDLRAARMFKRKIELRRINLAVTPEEVKQILEGIEIKESSHELPL